MFEQTRSISIWHLTLASVSISVRIAAHLPFDIEVGVRHRPQFFSNPAAPRAIYIVAQVVIAMRKPLERSFDLSIVSAPVFNSLSKIVCLNCERVRFSRI